MPSFIKTSADCGVIGVVTSLTRLSDVFIVIRKIKCDPRFFFPSKAAVGLRDGWKCSRLYLRHVVCVLVYGHFEFLFNFMWFMLIITWVRILLLGILSLLSMALECYLRVHLRYRAEINAHAARISHVLVMGFYESRFVFAPPLYL